MPFLWCWSFCSEVGIGQRSAPRVFNFSHLSTPVPAMVCTDSHDLFLPTLHQSPDTSAVWFSQALSRRSAMMRLGMTSWPQVEVLGHRTVETGTLETKCSLKDGQTRRFRLFLIFLMIDDWHHYLVMMEIEVTGQLPQQHSASLTGVGSVHRSISN